MSKECKDSMSESSHTLHHHVNNSCMWRLYNSRMRRYTLHLSPYSCTIGRFSLHYNCRLWTRVVPQVPWGLVLKLAHNHKHPLSTHSGWGPRTCFAEASRPGIGDRHGEIVVQLHLLLDVVSGLITPTVAFLENMLKRFARRVVHGPWYMCLKIAISALITTSLVACMSRKMFMCSSMSPPHMLSQE